MNLNDKEEEHLNTLFIELRALNHRHSWLSFAAWFATLGVVLYAMGQEAGIDAISVVGGYTAVLGAVSNVITFLVMKVRILDADRAHRRWHERNPGEESPYEERG